MSHEPAPATGGMAHSTEGQFCALLAAAGFTLRAVTPTPGPVSILDAVIADPDPDRERAAG